MGNIRERYLYEIVFRSKDEVNIAISFDRTG